MMGLFLLSLFLLPRASLAQPLDTHCTYTREYITTLEYLRSHSVLSIPEPQSRSIAEKVSRGCTGAAQRFIKVASALRGAGVAASDTVRSGLEFSARSDVETETFIAVFLKAYLAEFLDLDLGSSLKLARTLSTEFNGDILAVRDDFEALVHFCVDTKDLNLPRPRCAQFASRLAHSGENYGGGVADPFIRLFAFLRSDSGPRFTTGQALSLAENLIEGGRDSVSNFIQAYKYGISSHGLGTNIPEAIRFAKKLTFPDGDNHSSKN